MRTKNVTSVALLFMLMLLGQAMTGHLHQYPGMDRDSSLESESVVMASNSTDSDGDGVNDVNDSCPNGDTGWTSSYSTDHDTDGCQDTSEDTDDDNDGLLDVNDYCMVGDLGWISSSSTDYDSDGCKDSTEDMDDDNDGVVDSDDSCPTGELSWTSTSSTDADGDGCRDSTEDPDGGGNTGNNTGNNTSPCGTNLSYTTVYVYAPYMVMENQSFSASMYVNCEILNATMMLDYWIYDSNNYTVFSGNQSWNGTANNSWLVPSVSGLAAGYYTFHAGLYVNGTLVDSDYDSFMVYANSSGGGNNSGGGGNYTSPCGSNVNYTSVYAYAPYMVMENQSFSTSMYVNCEILNANMVVDHWIYDSYNNTVYSGNQSWYGTNSSSSNFTSSVSGLAAGYYTFHADLYVNGTLVDSDSDSFMVYANSSGGGGNQTSPCGYNPSYTSVYAYAPYSVMENQSFSTSMYVSCEIYNANMVLDYWIYDTYNYTVYSGNQSWTGANNNSNFNWSVGGLSAGTYTFQVMLYVNGTFVDSDSDGFMVLANNSGGGGNNGGNQTSPCGSNVNYTSVYAYAPYMVMENQSFSTSMYVNCEIYNANMVLVYWINDADINATSSLANGSMSWTGANNNSNFNWNVSGLSAGNYAFYVDLYVNGTLVDNDSDSFMVYAESSGGGGNNDDNNSVDDAHCLILQNASMNQTHHITVELVNTCSIGINYAGIDASTDNSEVFGLYDTWWYVIGGNTSSGLGNTYTMNWQLSFGPNLTTGTVVSIYLQATVLNCGSNNSWSHQCPNATDSMVTYQFTFNANNGNNNSGENNSGNNTTNDTDGDGIIDSLDNCLNGNSNWTSTATTDYDSDGCEDASEDTDDDNDGVSDSADAFPTDPSETEDTDGDGVGNNADTDDDNDGVGDSLDAFPLDSSEAFDNDEDGVGDNADMDDDNDGVSDQEDAFPFDGGASNDTDLDGVADAYDNCITAFNPSQADADMDGIGTECDADESSGNSGNNTDQGNNTGNNTDNNTDQGNNTENNTQNTDDLLVIGDCTFSEMNFDSAAHVIFYLSWTDTSDVDHCGTIQFELYSNEAPIHVQNFQDHVGAGNYDGVIFHRIINDFMTQSGDIQYGNGMGGYAYSWQGYCNGQQIEQANCQLNDYSIPDEFDTSLVHNKGALSMAHAGANTGGSQFFIMDRDDATWLDGVHSVFGQAIAGTIDGVEVTGIEVVDAISQVGVEGPSGSTPIHDVTILSAENIGTPQTIENPSLPDDDNGEDESIPSIGIIGTAVAISAGFFVAIRREDEE